MDDQKEQGGLGAFVAPEDNRRIPVSAVQTPVARPRSFRAPDDDVPIEDQGQLGTCVGEAEGGEVEVREKKDIGEVIPVSKLDPYRQSKAIDGIPTIQGTFPTITAGIKIKRGVISKKLSPDVRGLTHEETTRIPAYTQEQLDDAGLRVAAGYAFVPEDLESMLQAIFQNWTYTATLAVGDWSRLPVKAAPFRGHHRIRINGYEEIRNAKDELVDAKIFFRNSWGKNWAKGMTAADRAALENGNGYFLWSEYKLQIFEQIVYTDVPMDLILKARATPYIFTQTLKRGSAGPEVIELQKRLAKEKAKDGSPCFQGTEFVATFGPKTEAAVQRYQIVKGIVLSGTPETTGFGVLGPKTRASLNDKPKILLYPKVDRLRRQLRDIMAAAGQPITITAEYRTIEEQDALYAIGRTKPGTIITNAKGGDSFHNWRCAFDIAFSTASGISYDGPWNMVAAIGKILGLEWGGDWSAFPDKPHFQFTAGYSLQDFKDGKVDDSAFV